MKIVIDSADNCEMYSVNISWYCEIEGYNETLHVVDASALGELLLQYMPYTPSKKSEIRRDNVRPFVRR